MSIQSQIDRIKNNLSGAYNAVLAKGGTVPAAKTSTNLAEAVSSIPTGIDTSDATAAAFDIKQGKTAYVKGQMVPGALERLPPLTPIINIDDGGVITAGVGYSEGYVTGGHDEATFVLDTEPGKTITPTSFRQSAIYANTYATGSIYVEGDANLKAANIKKGVSIFGVEGTYEGAAGLVPATLIIGNPNSVAGIATTAEEPGVSGPMISVVYYDRNLQKYLKVTPDVTSNSPYTYETVVGSWLQLTAVNSSLTNSYGVLRIEKGPYDTDSLCRSYTVTESNSLFEFSLS